MADGKQTARTLLGQMTRKEKVAFCEGEDFWHTLGLKRLGIPSVMLCDGPHGLRKQAVQNDMVGINRSLPATCFPTAAATACSWDEDLLSRIGRAIGEEARAQGVGLVLGPGLNIKRSPLCGRNFEYFSEDPYLSGSLAAAYVEGMQSTGVGSCLKHFAANSQEYKRFSSDSVMDERTLRELYLVGFELAVKRAKPYSVMCSYNKLNGIHASDSKQLLTDILRTEWGFDGFVVTDWGAMYDRTQGFRAGCDLNMPGGSHYQQKLVLKALKDGSLDEKALDASVERILNFVFRARDLPAEPCDPNAHHALAREAAEKSAVLLKNSGVLPIHHSACLIGHMADQPRFQGAGSSHVNPFKIESLRDCLDWPYAPGCRADGSTDDALLSEAFELAKSVHTPVVVAGLPDSVEAESYDRRHMRLPEGQERLIRAVAAANPNTVVALLCGSPVETPWLDQISGLLYLGLPGQAGGAALANLLTGAVNPSGKLAETWPLTYSDVPCASYSGQRDAEYREGVFVGYRYYDSAKVPVRFPFGFGLSYTRFAYSNLTADGDTVQVTVKNVGQVSGGEAVQLFVCPPKGGPARPVRELKGFQKVYLAPGEQRTVRFRLNDWSFALWEDGWKVQRGIYTVQLGGLYAELRRDGEELFVPEWQPGTWYETLSGTPDSGSWKKLLGWEFISRKVPKGYFGPDSTILEMKEQSVVMRLLYRMVKRVVRQGMDGPADENDAAYQVMLQSSSDCAIRGLGINAALPDWLIGLLLKLANIF